MTKYAVVKKDQKGKILAKTPCPMTKDEAEMMIIMRKYDGYVYELEVTNAKSLFGTPDDYFKE